MADDDNIEDLKKPDPEVEALKKSQDQARAQGSFKREMEAKIEASKAALDSQGGDTAANRNKLAQQQAVYKEYMAAQANNGENIMSESQLNSFKNKFDQATKGSYVSPSNSSTKPSSSGGNGGGSGSTPSGGGSSGGGGSSSGDDDIPDPHEVDPETKDLVDDMNRAKNQGNIKRNMEGEIQATKEAIANGADTPENREKLAKQIAAYKKFQIAMANAGEDLIPESTLTQLQREFDAASGKQGSGSPSKAAGTDTQTKSNPSASGGVQSQQSQQSDAYPDSGLTTFERVGIKADRHLATRPASEWQHSPAVTTDAPHKFDCLAEAINYSLKQEQQTPMGSKKTSPSTLGFTNRAIPEHLDKSFLEQVVEMAFETSGAGGFDTQVAQVFAKHDRFNRSLAPKNAVFSGYTFFTRPRLCLRDWNICHDRKLAPLMTLDTQSIDFAIRCLLDTRFAHENENSSKTKLFDKMNPFNVPLCNAVRSVTGFNDPMLVTETTEGGFFSEDQTYVIGGDRMAKTYDINCMFRDYPGSPILAMIDFWTQYMAGLTDGSLQQYADAIDLNRMDYTVSIYRFLTDRTNRNIVRWAKCTGCYPVSTPSGVCFNLNESEFMIDAAAAINVPFKANRIEYDDPVILKEFNMLVRRYAGEETGLTKSYAGYSNMTSEEKEKQDQQFIAGFQHNVASNNFSGIPYIRMSPTGGYELVWLRRDMVGEYILGDVGAMTGIRTQTADKRETIKYRGSVSGDSDADIRFLI